ncbi:MAG TPA: hypothetical protein VM487_10920 [Phycisphaerae bacterium]|nr:hypothetical protein [Phycisphaerae bacterium]
MEHEDILRPVFSPDYSGTSAGQKFVFPDLCACCLRAADQHRTADFAEEKEGVFGSIIKEWQITAQVTYPICHDCVTHLRGLFLRRVALVLSTAAISGAAGSLLVWLIPTSIGPQIMRPPLSLAWAGIVLLLLAKLVRMPRLEDRHASRDEPVRLVEGSCQGLFAIEFSNKNYAERFAEFNAGVLDTASGKHKYTGTNLLRGKGSVATVIVALALGVVAATYAGSKVLPRESPRNHIYEEPSGAEIPDEPPTMTPGH